MASVDVGARHGGRKSVNIEVPLIPFIDLLLCCIMFLLVSAVWTQIGQLVVEQQPGVGATDGLAPQEPFVVVELSERGYVIASDSGERREIPLAGGAHDLNGLREGLGHYRRTRPEIAKLHLAPDDGVRVEQIVDVMGQARGVGFRRIRLDGERTF